ncbi:hypothetical protein [Agrobacterium rosae]|uniref:hypothetical protein n=1 Tax=Agrobacterium rosae TaxID=1972867 RepID=UPI00203374FA|nr:hypothetical protein [Agrobacterium rosae]MCM2431945.1 hypothetical protein [Agrobacterium rosae]
MTLQNTSQPLSVFFSLLTLVALGFSHPWIALISSLLAVFFGLVRLFPEVITRILTLMIIYRPTRAIAPIVRNRLWFLQKAFRQKFGGNRWIEGLDLDDMTPTMRKKEEQSREREAEADLLFMD